MRDIKNMHDLCDEVRDLLDQWTTATVSRTSFFRDEAACKSGKRCGICGSANTLSTYYRAGATSDGAVWTDQVRCVDCGGYTLYEYNDRM